MSKRRPSVDVAKEKYERALLKFKTAKLERMNKIMAKYDATESNQYRRQPVRENKGESGIYDMTKRLRGCNLGRDLERNYSPAKSMLHQFRINVVGSLGKIRVNAEGGDEATKWFNEVWAKDCDFRDDVHWSQMEQNVVASVLREGDVLKVIDDNLIEDSGKTLMWESDQIVPVSEKILKASEYKDMTQDNGIIRDEWGRVVAYSVTGKHGLSVIENPDDVTFWKREQARLIRNPWRLNQGRGIPSLLTPSSNFVDLYEILASELMSAKKSAKQYAFVKRSNAVTDWDDPTADPEWLPENDGRTSADVAQDGANQSTHTARNYERLEALTGGLTDYLDPDDSVEFPKLDHPNSSLAPFLETVHGYGGSALGLARAYTILRADSSYTSFRGDMIMTWVTFLWLQKWLERADADWTARRVLTWAQRKGEIATLGDEWERSISWTWPTMPEVNEKDAETATALSLKNGSTNYAELLGPDWKDRMDDLAEQIDYAREKNLPLSVLEQKSGGMADSSNDNIGESE
jgi:capsid protein